MPEIVQTPLQRFERFMGDDLREVMLGGWDEPTFFKEIDLATKNEVPMFTPGPGLAYTFITQAAQDILDARQKALDAYDAWKKAGSPPVTTPYWETRG